MTELEKLKKDYEKLERTLKLFTDDCYKIEFELLEKIENLEYENKILRENLQAVNNVNKWLREKQGDYGE